MTRDIVYLNNGPMIKDMFFKDGDEKFKPSNVCTLSWWI
jgi:hypothetical protein